MYDIKRLGLDVLPYPLLYYAPLTAFTFRKPINYLPKNNEKVEVGFEIVLKVRSTIYQHKDIYFNKMIESYRLCVGLASDRHLKEISNPTNRDIGVCEYYSRWSDKSNWIGEFRCDEWEDLKNDKIIVKNSRNIIEARINYIHGPNLILNFISSFTPIYKNSYICLGHLARLQFVENERYEITIKSLGFHEKIDIVAC